MTARGTAPPTEPTVGDLALAEALKRLRAERATPLPTTGRWRDVAAALAALDDSPVMTAARRQILEREVAAYEREHSA